MYVLGPATPALAFVARTVAPASLAGTVFDPQGLVLPGAVVLASGPAREQLQAVTGPDGDFYFENVRPGPWNVSVEFSGFTPAIEAVEAAYRRTELVSFALDFDYGVTETVVVVGSRRADEERSVTESPVPVDVLTADVLASQSRPGVLEAIRTLAPSFNVNLQPLSNAATIVRPVNFRNLPPDHLLLLVNGKRRHRGAVIAWLGSGVAEGSQGPDLSVVPLIAIRQAELLRDGAAAQYGSDAIAGVINLELRDARSGGSVEVRTGLFGDRNAGDRSTCGLGAPGGVGPSCSGIGGRGGIHSVAGNVGLPLGNAGFVNLSLEYGGQSPTNRGVQRLDAAHSSEHGDLVRDPAQVWGAPAVEDNLKTFAHFGTVLPSGLRPYGHANYATRTVTGDTYFRHHHSHPHHLSGVFRGPYVGHDASLLVGDREWARTGVPGAGGCPVISVRHHVPDAAGLAAVEADPDCFTFYTRFPGGFTPRYGGTYSDQGFVAGLSRLTPGGFTWDASLSIGRSRLDQFIHDTVNASLGYDTPTSFDPGSYEQQESNANFDVAGPLGPRLHVAAGAEARNERFSIVAGGEPSWAIGPYADQGFASGSSGFTGYRPDITVGLWSRRSAALYGDVELHALDLSDWLVATAVRYERFDDFGDTFNGKLATRYALTDSLSARAAFSTGFRAPTPGQQNALNVTTAFIDGDVVNNGVVPSTSAVALAHGGRALQPERSRNFSGGLVYAASRLSVTADWFRIRVGDRLALSREIRLREDEIVTLLAEGIPDARNFPVFRFFVNDFSTITEGVDLLASWRTGPTSLTFAWNHTDTQVLDARSAVIDAFRVQTLEQGLPSTRWHASVQRDFARFSLNGRLNWYGSYWDSEDGRHASHINAYPYLSLYPPYSGKALVDFELGLPLADGVDLAVGAENAFNVYPDVNPWAEDTVGNRYGQFSPFGFNGAYYYARLSYAWQ